MTTEPEAAAAWPELLAVEPLAWARGSVRLPGSKSLSNRALLLAALARGDTQLVGLLDADDTRVMLTALCTLGISVEHHGDMVLVHGRGGHFPVRTACLQLGNAGTAMRPLAAVLAFAGGHYRLDGVARMRERPIGDLVDALRVLGARITYRGASGFPPLDIAPPDQTVGLTQVRVRGEVSSQFLSGLLMAAPGRAPAAGLTVGVTGELISRPYVAMTVAMMRSFGAQVQELTSVGAADSIAPASGFQVAPGSYRAPGRYVIEGDASGASYFLALGALAGGPVRVLGVGSGSLQGDLAFAGLLRQMGAQVRIGPDWVEAQAPSDGPLQAVDVDATPIPDAAMTAAVLALFAHGRTRLRGIGSWRVKETDRIAAMAKELSKLGAQVESGADWIAVHGPAVLRPALVDTYDDHRMAMCLALAAAGGVCVQLRAPGCVAKTFPGYFAALASLRLTPPTLPRP